METPIAPTQAKQLMLQAQYHTGQGMQLVLADLAGHHAAHATETRMRIARAALSLGLAEVSRHNSLY